MTGSNGGIAAVHVPTVVARVMIDRRSLCSRPRTVSSRRSAETPASAKSLAAPAPERCERRSGGLWSGTAWPATARRAARSCEPFAAARLRWRRGGGVGGVCLMRISPRMRWSPASNQCSPVSPTSADASSITPSAAWRLPLGFDLRKQPLISRCQSGRFYYRPAEGVTGGLSRVALTASIASSRVRCGKRRMGTNSRHCSP